jgi:hypothetical protein
VRSKDCEKIIDGTSISSKQKKGWYFQLQLLYLENKVIANDLQLTDLQMRLIYVSN